MSHLIRFLCWLLPARLAHLALRALIFVPSLLPSNGFLYCYTIPGIDGSPYLTRLLLPRWRGRRTMLHWIRRDDQDREPHNHPWAWFESTILLGGYTETRHLAPSLRRRTTYRRGDVNRVDDQGVFHTVNQVLPRTWSLVTTGARVGDWGFMFDGVFVPHIQFFAARGYKAGKGASKS